MIVSDNAKTFKAAQKYVEKYLADPDVRSLLEMNRIEWSIVISQERHGGADSLSAWWARQRGA